MRYPRPAACGRLDPLMEGKGGRTAVPQGWARLLAGTQELQKGLGRGRISEGGKIVRTQDMCDNREPSTRRPHSQAAGLSRFSRVRPRNPAPATLSSGLVSRLSPSGPRLPFQSLTHFQPDGDAVPRHTSPASTRHLCPASAFFPTCPPPCLQATDGQTPQKPHFLHPCINTHLMSIYYARDT